MECIRHLQDGTRRKFTWFLLKLLPCNPRIKGCEVILPETVIFSNGKPQIIIKNDKQYCVGCITSKVKVQLSAIQKEFFQIWNNRKRDTIGLFGENKEEII